MPLEFALRPRFDLKRPAPRRRLSWPRLHPLVLPIGAYWFAAVGLTYSLVRSVRSPSVNEADAAERDVAADDSSWINAPASEPPIQNPISASTLQADITQAPTPRQPEPEPAPLAEPTQEVPPPRQDLGGGSRTVAENPKTLSRQASAPVAHDEVPARERNFEPEPFEKPAEPQRELARDSEPEPSPKASPQTGSLPSCESAAATANQTIDVGSARGAPDLTRDAFAGVLEHGAYLTPCSIPPRIALEICAAVQNGNVVGVTVTTEPRDPAINACVRRAVGTLRFPRNSQLDVTRTRFERVR
jgi:hypothetical protein